MAFSGSPTRTMDRLVLLLLAISAAAIVFWPDYRLVQTRALSHLAVFAGRLIGSDVQRAPLPWQDQMPGEEDHIARAAHHIAFQFRKTPVDQARARAIFEEYGPALGENRVLALLAYHQLINFPPDGSKSDQRTAALSLLDWICAEGLKRDPGNSYFVYCQAARAYLSGNHEETLKLLQTADKMPAFNSHLSEVNRSETFHSLMRGDLPGSSPWHGLDGTHPFNAMSQWLYDRTRSAVKRYNQERALDVGLLHVNLAEKTWLDSSSARQAATGEQMCIRALSSLSKRSFNSRDWISLKREFLEFLEDVGETEKMRGYEDSFFRLRTVDFDHWVERTRRAQAQLGSESLTLLVFLAGLLALALPTWAVFLLWRDQPAFDGEAALWGLVGAAGPGVVFWTIWPNGLSGTYLFCNLVVSIITWLCALLLVSKSSKNNRMILAQSGVRGVVLGVLLLWMLAGVERTLATKNAYQWLVKVGTTPWVEQIP